MLGIGLPLTKGSAAARTPWARLSRLALVALGALIVTAALSGSALAAPAWLAPTNLSAVGANADQADVAVDPAGDAVAVWTRYDGSDYVAQAAERPAGVSWGVPVDLSAPGQEAEDPRVAIDAAGEAVVVWTRYDGSNFIVQGATKTAGGAWGAPVDLSVAGHNANAAEIVINPGGEAISVWQLDGPTHYVIQAATRPPGGAWREPIDLSLETENAYDPVVAVDPAGDAVAAWERFDGSNYIVQAASRPAGGVWQEPTNLSVGGASAEDPQVAMDEAGDAVAVWGRFDGTNWRIQGAGLPRGGTWGSPEDLSSAGSFAERPEVAVDAAGNAVAVWERFDGIDKIIQAASRPAGGVWQEPVSLSAAGENAANGEVAIGPEGNAAAVWQRYDGADEIVQAATRPPGGSWSAAENLSAPGQDAYGPEVGVDAGGDAVAVWPRYDGSEDVVQAAGHDVAGPQLRGLSIPTTGTVGVPLSFSVSPFDVWSAAGATTWSFGEGGAADGTVVSHTFAGPGTYTVKVTSADAVGNTSTADGTVTVSAPPAGPGGPGTKENRARAGRIVRVKGRTAMLALSCRGSASCAGAIDLLARGRRGPGSAAASRRGPRRVTLGKKSSYNLAAGRQGTIKVVVSKRAGALVAAAGRKGLAANLAGSGVVGRAVILKAVGHRHRR